MARTKKNLGIRADQDRWLAINKIARKQKTSVQKLVDAAIDKHVFNRRFDDDGYDQQLRPVSPDQSLMILMGRAASVLAEMISVMQERGSVTQRTKVRAAR